MKHPIAECHTCQTTYYIDNAPNKQGPEPIYGQITARKHVGHDVRPIHTMKRGQCAGAHVFDVNDYLDIPPTCPACLYDPDKIR